MLAAFIPLQKFRHVFRAEIAEAFAVSSPDDRGRLEVNVHVVPGSGSNVVSEGETKTTRKTSEGSLFGRIVRPVWAWISPCLRTAKKLKKKISRMASETQYILVLGLREPKIVCAQYKLRQGGGLSGKYQWRRLYELRRILRILRPQTAIEFGSGASTILFQKYVPNFVSLEESLEWKMHYVSRLASSRLLTGQALAAEACILVCDRVQTTDSFGEEVTVYDVPEHIAARSFELIYVDGPTNSPTAPPSGHVRDPHGTLPNVDAIRWQTLSTTILVDQRRASLAYLVDHLKGDWILATDIVNGFSKRRVYHSVLVKNNYFAQHRDISQVVRPNL